MAVTLIGPRARIGSATVTLGIEALLALFLVYGLAVHGERTESGAITAFSLTPPSVPRPDPTKAPFPKAAPRRAGAASPPNLRTIPTEIAAPVIVLPLATPVVVAPVAGQGEPASAGASAVAGPGTGAGGTGHGSGDGDGGTGDGGGGGDETPPHHRSGRLSDADYPRAAFEAGGGGTVSVRYTVTIDGHARNCLVTRSSGNAALDDTTCRLIEKRFRFDPSRDARGRPVESTIVQNHSWAIEQDPDPPRR